jgi:Ulp1 family protease
MAAAKNLKPCITTNGHEHVMASFGLTVESLLERRAAAAMSNQALDDFVALVAEAFANSGCPRFHVIPSFLLDGSENGHNLDLLRDWGTRRQGLLLQRTLLVPIHVEGHFVLAVVKHEERLIIVHDSWTSTAYVASARAKATALSEWLCRQQPDGTAYRISWNESAPKQNDNVSCGYFVAAGAFFWAHHGRLPTQEDFKAEHLFILHTLVHRSLASRKIFQACPPMTP